MNYLSFEFSLEGKTADVQELAIALLSEIGFESFTDEDNTFAAYIQEALFSQEAINEVLPTLWNAIGETNYTINEIPTQNWNQEWESNFEPVIVDSHCIVKAPFHKIEQHFDYEIIIEPKMSFGTGHHETTQLVLSEILATNCKDKTVVDCGCGTGVLAILAKMKGSAKTKAFDVDQWCYENTIENAERNNVADIIVECKGIESIAGETYDIIIANINRNILLSAMEQFGKSLTSDGTLILSGIYKSDLDIISESASKYHLHFISFQEKNNWISCRFTR
jgi:ribosomal protein L11 methyltransferase